jgi:hypothetical protein
VKGEETSFASKPRPLLTNASLPNLPNIEGEFSLHFQ